MKQILFSALLLLILDISGTAQSNFNGFTNFKKVPGNNAVVYFTVLNGDDFRVDGFNESLLKTNGILSSVYSPQKNGYLFKCKINQSISHDDIINILAGFDLKINPEDLFDKNNEIIRKPELPLSIEQSLAPHYPVFVNTGNAEADAADFERKKQEWIMNYPDEVNKLRGIEQKQEVKEEEER